MRDLHVDAYRWWKEKWSCWEYSDTPLVFPAVPAGTVMHQLYSAEQVGKLEVTIPENHVVVPSEVLDLYNFMAACFTPMTDQQGEIYKSLALARIAMKPLQQESSSKL